MKTGKKNLWLIASLCVAFVISMFFGFYSLNSKKANAVAEGTFAMEGAAIRMDGVEGLRFGAVAAADVVADVNANSNKSFGAFIAPLDWMDYLHITTTYSDSYDYYTRYKEAYAKVSTGTVSHNFNITPYKQRDDGSYELCITLKNVLYNNMSRTFFGLFCIVDNNGTPDNEADDTFTYATFSDNNKRSFAYVASAALTDESTTFNAAQKTNIYKTLQLALYKKAGVPESTAKSKIAAGDYLTYELELNTSSLTLGVNGTYDVKASLVAGGSRLSADDMLLRFSSSDTDVATVSGSTITAVGVGTATITATYANQALGGYMSTATISLTVAGVGEQIAKYKSNESKLTVSDFTANDTSITAISSRNNNGSWNDALDLWVDKTGSTDISFKVENLSENTLKLGLFFTKDMRESENFYETVTVSSATNAITAQYSGKNGAYVEIAGNTTKKVSVVLEDALGGTYSLYGTDYDVTHARIRFSPYVATGFEGSFTVSEITVGGSGSSASGYDVNFGEMSNGSVKANTATAAEGEKVYLTVTPATGYVLDTLTVTDESSAPVSVDANVFTMPKGSVTVNATFVKATYSIINNASDKVTVASSAQYGDTVNVSPVSGYKFVSVTYRYSGHDEVPTTLSYFIMPDSGVIITDAEISNDYDINLTNAKAYNANEEEITTAKPGEKVTIVANTPATGYEFDEWTSDVTLDGATSTTTFTMTANDVTISASYKLATYTITIDDSITDVWATVGGVTVTSAEYGSTVVLNTDRANSSVASYNGNSGNTFTLTGNITITAVTYETSYSITVTGGTASPSLAAAGTTITITAGTPAQGKEFSGWTISPSVTYTNDTSASSSIAYFTMPDDNVTITANYADRIYNVTVTNGTASPTSGAHGTSISITAADAPSGKEFKEWTGNVTFTDATSETTTFEIGYEDVEVMATYKDAVVSTTLTVVSSGVNDTGNIETVSNNSTEVIYNSKKDWPNQDRHYGYAKVKCTTADVTTIAFKIYNQATGNSNNTLNLYAAVRDSVGSQNDLYDNNAKTISSVTRGSVSGGNKAHFSSISKGNSATVSITLANSISKNTEFYIIFASMIDNGGFVGNFKIEFVELVYYTVTNNVDTIKVDKVKAAEGDTVTLTPKDNTKVVTAFNYTPAGGSATDVSGNTLTMPAKAVTINSVTLGDKPSALQIAAAGKGQGASGDISASKTDNYTLTCTDNWNYHGDGQNAHYVYAKLEGVSGNTVSFTVANTTTGNGNTNLNLRVTLATSLSYNYTDKKLGISSTNSDNKVTISTITKGNSTNVTITLSNSLSNSDLYIMLNSIDNNIANFVGTFTVTNFNVTSAS